MKLLKYIFNIVVWTTLGLYLLVVLTFQIPAVQEYLGGRMASLMADKLGTHVSVGRAVYKFPNHLTLYDVLIRDQQGKDMLKVGRLSARADLLPFTQGKVSIATAQIFGAHAKLYQKDETSKPNFQFVLDSLASKDTTKTAPLNLRINSLIMRYSSVSYDRYDRVETPERLNPNHLKLSDISAHIILKTLTEDSLHANIKRLSFKEKSGLDVNRLSMKFEGGKSHSSLQDFLLKMPGTEIRMDDVNAKYYFRGEHFVLPSLTYEGSILPSTITPSDIECFLPAFNNFESTLSIESSFKGQGEDIEITNLQVKSETGDINIDVDGWIKNITLPTPTWFVNINDLQLSDETVNFISENLNGEQIEVPALVTRLGDIHMKGFAKGTGLQELVTNNQLNTNAGNATINLVIDDQQHFNGQFDAHDINLRHLLDDDRFGLLSTKIVLSGLLPVNKEIQLNAEGTVQQFEYKGYLFKDINVNGTYSPDDIHGELSINDPNIHLNVEGVAQKQGTSNLIKLKTDLDNFSPQATHLSDKWGDARFSANIATDIKATSLNDAVGTIDINHFTMKTDGDDYLLDKLHLESGYDGEMRYITLNSDFADADIKGHFNLATLPQSITNFIAAQLPSLHSLPHAAPANNNFAVNAVVYKSDWLQQFLDIPVRLTKPLTLHGTVNDNMHQLNIECRTPQFFYNDSQYDMVNISILSPLNTLHYDASFNKISSDGNLMELQLEGSVYNNQLTTSLSFNSHDDTQMHGKITAMADFDTSHDGHHTTNVTIASSRINIKDTEWDIHPCRISYRNNHLEIKNFTIQHGDQHLMLSGTASASANDSLVVRLQDIEVGYILNLIDFHAVEFSGLATGNGHISGVFGDLQANAGLEVKQFKFEGGRMGTLHAQVDWNKAEKQIDIHAIADDGPDAKTYINGYVSPDRNYIDLGIRADGTYLDFAQSFTSSFINHIDGHGNGAVRLIGPLDAINLTGQLVLNGRAHVTTLGCTYEMRNDTLRMVPNEIEFVHCPIYDIHGNQGVLSGGIHHQELTNLTYDIYVDTDNMMAYDFPDFGDEVFYGTVYVQGKAAIHDKGNGVVIEADVTPLKNSFLVYNASTPDVITNQEFIQWNTSNQQNNTMNNLLATQQDFRSDLTMRLKVNATPDAAIRLLMDAATGDYITLRGTGDIQTTYYNKGSFTMFGNYEVESGTYNVTIQNVIKKEFTFKEGGTIVFGGDPYDAQLDLQAQYIVNGVSLSDLNIGNSFANTVRVNCLMNITGQPRAPILDFDLDILNVNSEEKQLVRSFINGQEEMRQQVIYLLAVGRFYSQGANNATESEQARNSTSLAMQSLLSGTLSGQINSVLNSVIKSNNWNFGANISTGDEGWNNAEYEGLISGRLLNNRLLINGQFGYRDRATTATPSFIGDFDIRYLLYPSGNLALKVYNQSNDRYFTKSSLNTQGIGIIMKKDFNGWRDLFRKRKNNKTSNNDNEEQKQNTNNK